jgi:hypothetical protein
MFSLRWEITTADITVFTRHQGRPLYLVSSRLSFADKQRIREVSVQRPQVISDRMPSRRVEGGRRLAETGSVCSVSQHTAS